MKFTFAPESRPLEGYTIKRAIYRGGFGEVYYALTDAGREVALKLLQNNAEVELRGVQQCLNLSHPNLVTIFDVREDGDGDHWIIMEYVAGETLDATLRKHPQGMPVEYVRNWLKGLTSGIAYLHSRGIVHRDLKPANVFMENGVVKIGDVGLSKFIAPSRHSAQTQSVGTVHYMAPEVAKGRYGREVDVYATGIILYEMLTGTLPFDGESTGEILMKHLSEPPDLSKLPPRLQGVIGRALHKDPKERYSRIEALHRAFDDAVLGIGEPEPKPTADANNQRPVSPTTPGDRIHVQVKTPGNRKSWHREPGSQSQVPGYVKGALIGLGGLFVLAGFGRGGISMWLVIAVVTIGALIGNRVQQKKERKRRLAQIPKKRPIPVVRQNTPKKKPRPIPARLQSGDALGAMFAAVPIASMLIFLLAALKPSLLGGAHRLDQVDPAVVGLFSGVTLASTWVLMLTPHLIGHADWRKKISGVPLAMAGAFTGLLAYGLDQYLFR